MATRMLGAAREARRSIAVADAYAVFRLGRIYIIRPPGMAPGRGVPEKLSFAGFGSTGK